MIGAPASGAQPMTFRKGTVIAFDPATGENTINVAGANLTNLPMLMSGAETALAPGQTVGIVAVGTTLFVIGRVVIPNSPSYASASTQVVTGVATATGFALPAGFTDIVSVDLDVPPWATKAAVIGQVSGAVNNTSGVLSNLQASVTIPGSTALSRPDAVDPAYWRALFHANSAEVPVTPGGTLTVAWRATANWPAHVDNTCRLAVTAFFSAG